MPTCNEIAVGPVRCLEAAWATLSPFPVDVSEHGKSLTAMHQGLLDHKTALEKDVKQTQATHKIASGVTERMTEAEKALKTA